MARVQGGRPFRRPRAGRARAPAPQRSVEADAAAALSLRMDHGSQYLSDHFLNQVRYWGIRPSFGLLKEPETNGVVERWNRTLKEQAVYGRVFQNLADVRAAVAEFVERYNRCWRLEKLAYRTPLEAARSTSYAKPRSPNLCPRKPGAVHAGLSPHAGARPGSGLVGHARRGIDTRLP